MVRAWLCAAAVVVLLPVSADIIFKVPEVVVRHAAAHKSVGTGRSNARSNHTRGNHTRGNNSDLPDDLELRYEEYFIEHEISTVDARKAAQELNLDDVPPTLVGCGSCSRREMEYCETRLLADHCCCERRAFPEPFPWLPHTCYMGPSRCQPLAHDCARYARLRDCCCHRKLAERWKSILSSSTRLSMSGASLLLTLVLVL